MDNQMNQVQAKPNININEPRPGVEWVITEQGLSAVFEFLVKLPWAQSNDIVTYLRTSIRELAPTQAQNLEQKASETATGQSDDTKQA